MFRHVTPTWIESLKQTNEHGAEYWSARKLQPLLGYSQWRRFQQAIDRAKASCAASGNNPEHRFAGAGKPITGGKGAVQVVEDYHLSRFACYLIAQNGDPRKPEIAHAQKYFAIQARRQDAGYKGLYGGLGRDAIKRRRAIDNKDSQALPPAWYGSSFAWCRNVASYNWNVPRCCARHVSV